MIPGFERNDDGAKLAHAALECGAVLLLEPFFGDCCRTNDRRRQTGRGTTAATRIADAVFVPIGIVGVAGAIGFGDIAVVLAALVLIADQQRNRRTGGFAFIHTGQDFDRIRLLSLRDMARGARLAPVEFRLNIRLRQHHAGRAAIDDTADGRTVGFAKSRHRKNRTESIAGHDGNRK